MLKKVLIVVAILLAALLLIGALLPKQFSIERQVVVHSPSAKVHELVGELRRWDEWAPWKSEDPTIVTTYGASTTGVGAHQSWTGESGSGELTFTLCEAGRGIEYDMVFLEGEQRMPAKSWMHYAPNPDGTEVRWGMQGSMDLPVLGGWLALFADQMIGPMFESGLANLKQRAEAGV